ncbi:MAG: hypothetical protein KME20_13275 [Kaiparowitsia implicata GSE-PSE-MK54-09C]|nr:hypothetical protein [Kaiparowitsia implicata GSE-PSE-MK54-09C]
MKLSKYFTLAEMTFSQTALRRGINNTPGPSEIKNLQVLCEEVLDPVREQFGKAITPNSGYRSEELNLAIGGARSSQHIARGKAAACDFVVPGVSVPIVCDWIHYNLTFDQLIEEFWNPKTGRGWVHVSYDPMRQRRQRIRIG